MVEGPPRKRRGACALDRTRACRRGPSTPRLRRAVPLPVPGRNLGSRPCAAFHSAQLSVRAAALGPDLAAHRI